MTELLQLLGPLMQNQQPIFGPAETKAIALGNVMHNFAVNARKGREIYGSNTVRTMNAFNNVGGAGNPQELILTLLPYFVQQQQQQQTVDTPVEVEATPIDTICQRLDGMEAAIAKLSKGK